MRDAADKNWPDHEVDEFLDQIAAGGQDYRRLVERLPVIVYASELGEHGRWRYVSPQVEEILGYTAEEFKADPGLWARLLHPDDRLRALEVESKDFLGNRNTRPVEYRMRHPQRQDRLDARRGGARGRRDGGPGLARGALRHQRAQEHRGRPAARALPAGGRRQARRAGPAERRPRFADGGGRLADRRNRRGPMRLHLGGRPRRPPAQPARRARGRGARRRSPRLRRAATPTPAPRSTRAPRRSFADWASEERFTMPPVLRTFGAAQQPGGDDRRQGPPLRRARRPLDRAAPLHAQGRPLPARRRQRPRRRLRAPRRRPGSAPPRPPRRPHRPAQPAQLRRRARRRAAARRPARARRSGSSSSTSTTSS